MKNTEAKEKRTRRFAIALTPSDYERIVVLAKVTGKLPAQAVRDVVVQYLDRHAADIEEAIRANEELKKAMTNLNARQMSLFD